MPKTTIIEMRRRIVEMATLLVDGAGDGCVYLGDVTAGVEARGGLGVADSFAAAVLRQEGFTVQTEGPPPPAVACFVVQRDDGAHVE